MKILHFFISGIALWFLCSYIELVFKALSDGTLHMGLPTYEYLSFLADFRLMIALLFSLIYILLVTITSDPDNPAV